MKTMCETCGQPLADASPTELIRQQNMIAAKELLEKEGYVVSNICHIEKILTNFQRYEIAKRMDPTQWAAAWELNLITGKPFDQIIDELGPFYRPHK